MSIMKNRKLVTIIVGLLNFTMHGAIARAEPIRVAMPSKSLTFLNYYLADKFGLFKNEGIEASFPVGKADVQLTAVVTGDMEYIAAGGTVLRGAATGVPVKAMMFTLDKAIFYLMARPETKRIQDLKGKAIAVTAIATTDDAVRTDIEIMREQAKFKAQVPLGQVLDYSLLKEVLAEMKK